MADIELKARGNQPQYGYSALSLTSGTDANTTPCRRRPSRWSAWQDRLRTMFCSRRSRRVLYIGSGIILMLAWIGLILAFARSQQQTENNNVQGDAKAVRNISGLGEIWFLAGTLLHIDTNARTLAVQWSGKQYHWNDTKNPLSDFVVSEYYFDGLNIYRDVRAIKDEYVSYMMNDSYDYFMLDNATALPIGNVGIREWDAFNTDVDLVENSTSVWTQPIRGYPFDIWTGSLVIAAHIDFTISRPGLVKFTVIAVIIVNWLSTIVIFLLTGEALINGYKTEFLAGTDMLSVLFAALFALPGVRSLLPGAPDFGSTIDLVGILPNVIIISLCTSCWAVAKLRWQAKQKAESNKNVGKART
ncbi:hypothetical protein BD626DRAFT_632449 [Schizophyllum amplum]|uniref:Uncharacterized protein n=1 Tax=Schizophyllum amplum TaxID=97359 RepID=A0A550C6F1_9AGAR|nr:hypothetical protein BD626DRAFT_632449 [Auriculariopsis ampla]